jgi:hypothetical protein
VSEGALEDRLSIEQYARLQIELSEGDRERVLREHGLDEAAWEAIDRAMQARLSRAMASDVEGVPPLLVEYDRALRLARAVDVAPMELGTFARATAAIATSRDVPKTLERLGTTIEIYLRASRYWAPRLATDEALAAAFEAAKNG